MTRQENSYMICATGCLYLKELRSRPGSEYQKDLLSTVDTGQRDITN